VKVKIPDLQPLDPADINAIKSIPMTCKNDFIMIRDKSDIFNDVGYRDSCK